MPGAVSELRRQLGLVDATAIFVGIILGSGIFVAPAAVAGATSSAFGAAGLWVLGGFITACGGFCYAECGARLPHTGGFYVFYREAFGDAVAFVGGWAALFVTYPASIAAIALILAQYLGEVVPWASRSATWAAAIAILLSGFLNVIGVKAGTWTQRVLTGAKVTALATLCLAALLTRAVPLAAERGAQTPSLTAAWTAILSAMVVLLWTYDGWSDVSLVAGELRDPGRNLGRAVLLGTTLLVALYGAIQLAVAALLPAERAAASSRVVAEAVREGLGADTGRLVALLVVVSTFGSINGIVFVTSRLGFAMARDGAFLRWFGVLHPQWETPARSLVAVVVASLFYVFVGGFRNLVNYFSFNVWIFYGLTAVALVLLRHRRVGEDAVWKAPGGFVPPAVLLLTATGMTMGLLLQNPRGSLYGLAMFGVGFLVYLVWRRLFRAPGYLAS